uniref:Uncharacterized protein n=1 Tax=Anguilla anguilla TaxID=7936 RepID=A0A0E9WUT4_ANGAN
MCVLRLLLQNRKQQPWHVEEAPEVSLGGQIQYCAGEPEKSLYTNLTARGPSLFHRLKENKKSSAAPQYGLISNDVCCCVIVWVGRYKESSMTDKCLLYF